MLKITYLIFRYFVNKVADFNFSQAGKIWQSVAKILISQFFFHSHLFDAVAGNVAHCDSEFPRRLDVDVVDAAADANDDPEVLELFEVLLRQVYCVPHERADGLV